MDIFYLDKEVKKGNIKELDKIKDKPLWIDITDISKEEADILGKGFNIHHLTIEDLINQGIRIKVEEFPDY